MIRPAVITNPPTMIMTIAMMAASVQANLPFFEPADKYWRALLELFGNRGLPARLNNGLWICAFVAPPNQYNESCYYIFTCILMA